jgi:GNAT superfamily N-acetyltransferase
MTIRRATPADGAAFLNLVQALADFERLPGPDQAARERLLADAFGPEPRYQLLVAEDGGEVVAYAAYFMTYSTFRARPTLYLEDLFVHPDSRRRGIATAMMTRLRQLASEHGCGRFEWSVLDWNEGAQKLYDAVGATRQSGWWLMRVDL